MEVIDFSKEVRDRANRISKKELGFTHKYREILEYIAISGHLFDAYKDFENRRYASSLKLIDAEKNMQDRLRTYQIFDDESANKFMNGIEYEIEEWWGEFCKMRDRHNEEIEKFLAAIA